ncbi:MAG: class I SAM-dependent methyltransferase [Opitutales bacterium]|nr:class I SAM-dependent methyltransferase [Opitutales bacterium]
MTQQEADLLIYQYQGKRILNQSPEQLLAAHQKKVAFYTQRLERFLPKDKDARIVDIPCGDGNILYFLKALGYHHACGYDLDESRVQAAKDLGLNASVRDAFKAVQEVADCDVIFSIDFFEHIDKAAAFDLLQLMHKALKPGGKIILRTPVTDSIFGGIHLHNDFTHRWAVNSQVWEAIAGANGFTLKAIIDERPVPVGVKGFVRYWVFRLGTALIKLTLKPIQQTNYKVWSPSVWFVLQK